MANTVSDVVNWAYQYNLACAKLTSAQSAASSSATRSEDITKAQATFNSTMKSLVPTDAQSSVQFQYFDALTAYNSALGAATTEKERQAAMTSLYTTLSGITLPSNTTTLESLSSDAATARQTLLSNANAKASAAGSSWVSATASSAKLLNAKTSEMTESVKAALAKLGVDTSNITAPTVSNETASSYLAGAATALAGGSGADIMNAALTGYLLATQSASTSSDSSSTTSSTTT